MALLLYVNLFTFFFTTVLSKQECPFCANLKSECDKEENSLLMDCTTMKIKNESAITHWKEPNITRTIFSYIEDAKEWADATFRCIAVDYQLQYMPLNKSSNPNATTTEATTPKIDFEKNYTYKCCMFEVKGEKACDWASSLVVLDDIQLKIHECKYVDSIKSAALSTLPDRLIVFIISAVLVKLSVYYCQ